jgi:hypothetical protein
VRHVSGGEHREPAGERHWDGDRTSWYSGWTTVY